MTESQMESEPTLTTGDEPMTTATTETEKSKSEKTKPEPKSPHAHATVTKDESKGKDEAKPTTEKAKPESKAETKAETPKTTPAKTEKAKPEPKTEAKTKPEAAGTETKPETPKPTPAPKAGLQVLSGAGLASVLAKGDAAVSGLVYTIPLSRIVANENPRDEPETLFKLGYKLVDKKDKDHSLIDMCLSSDMDTVRAAVALFEQYENEEEFGTAPENDESLEKGEYKDGKELVVKKRQSILALARQLSIIQLQPVIVRKMGDVGNRVLLLGQRRCAAIAYMHAKSRVQVADGVEGAKVRPATVLATESKATGEEAWELAVRENMGRLDFTPIQMAVILRSYTERVNPETGQKWTLKSVAEHLGLKYGTARNTHALALPRIEDEVDATGKVIKKGKGLTDDDREAVASGKKGLAWAYKKALGEQHYTPGTEKGDPKGMSRRKVLPLKEVEKLFDDTNEQNTERRKALAEVMGLTLENAVTESEKRIDMLEKSSANQQKRKNGAAKNGKDAPETDTGQQGDEGDF